MNDSQPSADWATEQLIAALNDPDWWIRELAVMRLRDRQDPETFEPLLRMLNDPHSGVRMNAILALGRTGNARAFDPLLGLFTQTDDINLAARALAWLGDQRAVEPLITALRDSRPVVRLSAAEALGELHDRRAVEPLIVALTDPEVSVRQYAATALGLLGDQRAVEPLLQVLATTKTMIPSDFANSVTQLHDQQGVQADASVHFFRALTNTDPARIAMVNALAQLGDRRAVEPLIEIIHTEPGDMRCFAAGALGDLGDQKAFEPLVEALRDDDDRDGARAFAAAAIGKLRDQRALSALLDALVDPNEVVRMAAAEGLGYLGNEHAIPALEQAYLYDEGSDDFGMTVKDAAQQAIAQIKKQERS